MRRIITSLVVLGCAAVGFADGSSPAPSSSGATASPAGNPAGDASPRGHAAQKDAGAIKTEAAKLNPLAPFMARWMTSKDYVLLAKPGMGDSLPPSPSAWGEIPLPRGTPSPTEGGNTGRNPPPDSFSAGIQSSPITAGANPFLQFVLAAPPKATTPPAVAPAPAPAAGLPLEPALARPQTPAIAKPSDDAKYFKQLKRF